MANKSNKNNKVNKGSQSIETTRDKGVNSTELLDKKLAIAWGILIVSICINVAAGCGISCLYPIDSRLYGFWFFEIMILLSYFGYVFYESRLSCDSLENETDNN